jgi:Kef-type K+ transport system membrane component KefB
MFFDFLPTFPLKLSEFLLFGLVLLAGLVGGRLAALTRVMPVITGYILVGFICGPGGFNLITESLLGDMRVFVDISLGLILFDLGRRIDLRWLASEKWLLMTGLVESALTFALLTLLFVAFDVPLIQAAVAGAVGVATSAAVVMRVASDVGSEGPVTRRAFSLVAINNMVALLLFTSLLPFVHLENRIVFADALLHPLYLIAGSVLLGAVLFQLLVNMSRWLKRTNTEQFILQLAMIVAAVGLAAMLKLSVLLTLLTLGLMARNVHPHRRLPVVEFGDVAQLFFVVLFVMTGAGLKLGDFSTVAWLALVFVIVRFAAKALPIFAFGTLSKLSLRQSTALSLSLTPLAGLAAGMTFMLGDMLGNNSPALSSLAGTVLLASVTLMQLVGPVAARFAFTYANEVDPNT